MYFGWKLKRNNISDKETALLNLIRHLDQKDIALRNQCLKALIEPNDLKIVKTSFLEEDEILKEDISVDKIQMADYLIKDC